MTKTKAKPKAVAKKKPAARRSIPAEAFKFGDVVAEPPVVNMASSKASTVVLSVGLDLIDPSPFNPRSTIDEAELKDLAASIAEHGLLQPLVVRIAGAERYELIAGHRRLAALKLNDAITAPCIIRSISDVGTVRALQIIENLQRVDIDPMDEAGAFVSLQAEDPERWTAAAIGRAIGKSDRFVAQRMQLARNLAPELQERVKAGTLKIAVARTLATAPASLQLAVASNHWAIEDAATARQQLKSRSVPVEAAAFAIPLYTGDYILDDGKRYFVDVDQFQRLQQEAAHAKVDELRQNGWPNAKLITGRDVWEYRWADTGVHLNAYDGDLAREIGDLAEGVKPDDVNALVFVERERDLHVVKGVVARTAWPGNRPDDDEEDDEAPGQSGAERKVATDAFNASLKERLAGRPDLACRLFVYSTIGHLNDIDYSGDAVGALAPWREHLREIVEPDDEMYDYGPADAADDTLWGWLLNQNDATIDAMMARLVGAAISISAYRGSTGLHRALASALDLSIPAFLLPPPDEPEADDEEPAAAEADGPMTPPSAMSGHLPAEGGREES